MSTENNEVNIDPPPGHINNRVARVAKDGEDDDEEEPVIKESASKRMRRRKSQYQSSRQSPRKKASDEKDASVYKEPEVNNNNANNRVARAAAPGEDDDEDKQKSQKSQKINNSEKRRARRKLSAIPARDKDSAKINKRDLQNAGEMASERTKAPQQPQQAQPPVTTKRGVVFDEEEASVNMNNQRHKTSQIRSVHRAAESKEGGAGEEEEESGRRRRGGPKKSRSQRQTKKDKLADDQREGIGSRFKNAMRRLKDDQLVKVVQKVKTRYQQTKRSITTLHAGDEAFPTLSASSSSSGSRRQLCRKESAGFEDRYGDITYLTSKLKIREGLILQKNKNNRGQLFVKGTPFWLTPRDDDYYDQDRTFPPVSVAISDMASGKLVLEMPPDEDYHPDPWGEKKELLRKDKFYTRDQVFGNTVRSALDSEVLESSRRQSCRYEPKQLVVENPSYFLEYTVNFDGKAFDMKTNDQEYQRTGIGVCHKNKRKDRSQRTKKRHRRND